MRQRAKEKLGAYAFGLVMVGGMALMAGVKPVFNLSNPLIAFVFIAFVGWVLWDIGLSLLFTEHEEKIVTRYARQKVGGIDASAESRVKVSWWWILLLAIGLFGWVQQFAERSP